MRDVLKILKTFYRFETKKRGWFVVFIALVVVSAVTNSIFPYFYKLLVDTLPTLDYDLLSKYLLLFVGIRVLGLIFNSLAYLVGDLVNFSASIHARRTIFAYLQKLDFAFHADRSTGSLISAMKRGDGAFFSLHFAIHYRIARIFIQFLVMIYFFSSLDSMIALFTVVSFLVNLLVTKYIVGLNITRRKEFVDEEDRISGIIVDNIINFETVKIFSKEAWEQKRLKNAFKVWMKKLWGYSHSFRVLDISVGTIVNLSIYLILLFTLNRSVGGDFSVGDFVLVLGFVNNFFPRLFDLVWGFRDIAKHYADIEKYFGILDYDVKVKDPKNPVELTRIKGEIVYDNVGFSYEGGTKDAVKDIDLTIRQGQSIALVGRSGSGKTTLVKLLMRFFDLEEGKITIDEVDIKNMKKADLRSFIGLVPQEPVLFNNTVGYNIGYGKGRASKKEIRASAKIANLDGFIETLPKKYKTHVGERGIKLSGGQKQRLAIARMVLSDPDIVIFDEATSQLDSENEALIQDAFWRAVKDKTTIIIAHRLSTAMRADKIVVMEKGKIVEKGSHKELVSNKDGLYKYFWDLQVNVD